MTILEGPTGTPLMERALCTVIVPYIQKQGYSPTYREIAEGLGISISASAQLVGRMKERGLLKLNRGRRGIQVVRRSTALAA